MEAVMVYKIKVNGTKREVDADGDTPLLWVLRDVLGMTGTKFGCGASAVHVDGQPVRSRVTTIDRVGASKRNLKKMESVMGHGDAAVIPRASRDAAQEHAGVLQEESAPDLSSIYYSWAQLLEMNAKFIAAMAAAIRAGLEHPPRVGIDRTPGTKNPSYYIPPRP